ncbi:primosomal protein N' [Seminibacterium arietis]|uniref:Replication restart protein PriA n=1 Tax=Seminibacterium arietis TaxID=1173502 RepID=A0ABW3I7L4_9PAST
MKLVRIALAVPLFQFFDYLCPLEFTPQLGCRVIVPFGHQQRVGIVVDFPENSDIDSKQLKFITALLDEESIFNDKLWKLLIWAANYYQAPLGEVLFQALPVKLRQGESPIEKSKIFFQLTSLGHEALNMNQMGVIHNNALKCTQKQIEVLSTLAKEEVEKGNNRLSPSILSTLQKKGYVEIKEKYPKQLTWQQRLADKNVAHFEDRLKLNQEQALALSQLVFQQGFTSSLIDGVTGAGKTEVYLQFIEQILNKGRQVLVLVPEIGLTPQTVQRFNARFAVEIDVLHSNLNESERLKVWYRAKTGQSAVVIGTRSAIFTQFYDLGLIVIDEEHDASFKQQDNWRYHARDLAVMYAKQLDIPILLGSATPSLESLHNVKNGKYQHIVLSKRAINNTALRHFIIDMKQQRVKQGLSRALIERIQTHLEQGNQVLLFLNRRGFAPVLLCHECGWIAQCQHCEKPYTYHQKKRSLRCHHCSSQKPIPRQCGHCGSTHLITTGLGTEQLEEALTECFPHHHVTRIDRDSTTRKGVLEKHLQNIRQGKSQILIGTQMLAKGHHFPNVTLVALLNIDNSLFSLDFRAEERLAQLYVQVAGRAGRAEKYGEVILQTHYPEHPLLRTLLSQGYAQFAEQALLLRQNMGLPPFCSQALFKAQSRSSEQAENLLKQLLDYFNQLVQQKSILGLQILGPIPALFVKKAGYYRWHLLLQHQSRQQLQQILTYFRQDEPLKKEKVRWFLDVDPIDLS